MHAMKCILGVDWAIDSYERMNRMELTEGAAKKERHIAYRLRCIEQDVKKMMHRTKCIEQDISMKYNAWDTMHRIQCFGSNTMHIIQIKYA